MANLLDSRFVSCGIRTAGFALPVALVVALVSYISYTFFWLFIPEMFKVCAISRI